MILPNTDLLPPIFERILEHGNQRARRTHVREDFVRAVENAIVNAAAVTEREGALLPSGGSRQSNDVLIATSDRLSGGSLSRLALAARVQQQTDLDQRQVEIGLLLLEAQVDLRLAAGGDLEMGGIRFSPAKGSSNVDTSWCKNVLAVALQSTAGDKPSAWKPRRGREPEGFRVLVDALQLTAALRDAVPYRIEVAHYRVEPLLKGVRDNSRIRLLHISDLHLVEDLLERGHKRFLPIGVPTHAFDTAREVSNAVGSLVPRFDVLAATGDLSTDGAAGSFRTALQYVQGGEISGRNPMRIAAHGLGASHRILVPGNHDRYGAKPIPGQRIDQKFEEVIGGPKRYPYVVGFRPDPDDVDSMTLIFFVFDSTWPLGDGTNTSSGYLNRIAKGTIGDQEIDQAVRLARAIADEKKVRRLGADENTFLSIGNMEKTVRIALLHHHPVAEVESKPGRRGVFRGLIDRAQNARAEYKKKIMKMDGSDRFLDRVMDCGVQMILFGHQHRQYRRVVVSDCADRVYTPFGTRNRVMHAFCCPTTLQYDAAYNGFYVFDFIDERTAEWTSIGSKRDKKGELQRMINVEHVVVAIDEMPTGDVALNAYRVPHEYR